MRTPPAFAPAAAAALLAAAAVGAPAASPAAPSAPATAAPASPDSARFVVVRGDTLWLAEPVEVVGSRVPVALPGVVRGIELLDGDELETLPARSVAEAAGGLPVGGHRPAPGVRRPVGPLHPRLDLRPGAGAAGRLRHVRSPDRPPPAGPARGRARRGAAGGAARARFGPVRFGGVRRHRERGDEEAGPAPRRRTGGPGGRRRHLGRLGRRRPGGAAAPPRGSRWSASAPTATTTSATTAPGSPAPGTPTCGRPPAGSSTPPTAARPTPSSAGATGRSAPSTSTRPTTRGSARGPWPAFSGSTAGWPAA